MDVRFRTLYDDDAVDRRRFGFECRNQRPLPRLFFLTRDMAKGRVDAADESKRRSGKLPRVISIKLCR